MTGTLRFQKRTFPQAEAPKLHIASPGCSPPLGLVLKSSTRVSWGGAAVASASLVCPGQVGGGVALGPAGTTTVQLRSSCRARCAEPVSGRAAGGKPGRGSSPAALHSRCAEEAPASLHCWACSSCRSLSQFLCQRLFPSEPQAVAACLRTGFVSPNGRHPARRALPCSTRPGRRAGAALCQCHSWVVETGRLSAGRNLP